MPQERLKRVSELFHRARELPPNDRRALLDAECGAAPDIRAEVEKLLAQADPEATLEDLAQQIEQIVGPARTRATPDEMIGRSIGPYRLRDVLGRGGMGLVYLADQTEPVRRRVALKLIKVGMDTKEVVSRFEAERQALAMMNHENVARVFDGGATPDGRPFFVMEHVPGEPITTYCDRHRLTIKQRLELFMQACEGVQHAHQKAIIHRDIKPTNILVTASDAATEPRSHEGRRAGAGAPSVASSLRRSVACVKVIDFGVAKALSGRLSDGSYCTEYGRLIGTPEYMSPEQAEMNVLDIDTRTDIYSLGVLLYELLTGVLPYDAKRLRSAGLPEIQRMIRETPAVKPSTRLTRLNGDLAAVAVNRGSDARALERQLRGDLDWITLMAMDKDRTRRYATASDFAADVRRHLNHEPVVAGPPSVRYRVGKFVRRNRGGVLAAAAFVLLLAGSAVASTMLYLRAEAQRRLAEKREKETEQVAEFQASQLSEIDVEMMGVRLRHDLIAQRRAALENLGLEEAEVEAEVSKLEATLAGVNFTDVALDTLDENIFERALDAIEEDLVGQPSVQARLLQTVATMLRELGLVDRANAPQNKALEIRRHVLGNQNLYTLDSISEMGRLLQSQGKFAEAEPYQREALEAQRRTLGDVHPSTLRSLNNLGHLLQVLAKFAEAEVYHREALVASRRALGDGHPITQTAINNLGALLQKQGKYGEAESYYLEVLETSRRVLGDSHNHTLAAKNNIGMLFLQQGKFAKAEPYLRDALEAKRRTLGADHPDTLTAINNMGGLLEEVGKWAEAEPCFREALDGRRRLLGDEHPDTLTSISCVGDVLLRQGKYADAESFVEEALEGRRRVLGNDHPDTLNSISHLGSLLRAQGKLAEAEPYLRAVLECHCRTLGDEHPTTLTSMNNLGFLLQEQDKLSDAEPFFREALAIRRSKLGDENPDTLISISNMGRLLRAQGKLTEAEGYYREALDGQRRWLANDHPNTVNSINNMAGLLRELGRLAEAEPLVREALERSRRTKGDDHPNTLNSISNMGAFLRDLHRYEEAEALGDEAVRRARSVLPPRDRLIGACLKHHAWTLVAMDRFAEAEAEMLEVHEIFVAALGEGHKEAVGVMKLLSKLYDSWHAAEPDAGHDAKAAEWRQKLEAWQAATQPAEGQTGGS